MPGFVTETALFLLRPSNVIALFLVVGVVLLLARRRTGGLVLVGLGTFAYLVLGFAPVGKMALGVLEQRFPAAGGDLEPPAGILVLGGAIDPAATAAHGQIALNDAAERVVVVADLARRYPKARILVSGGPARHPDGAALGATAIASLLDTFGIDPARIELEPDSLNTWRNAVFAKAVAEPQPDEVWLVVTSAWHMPRAIGALRAAGWTSLAAGPVDYRSANEGLLDLGPAMANGLQHANLAAREYLALAAYRVTGRSASLLPAPDDLAAARPSRGSR